MGLSEVDDQVVDMASQYPDVEFVAPVKPWSRPSTTAAILERIDPTAIADLVFDIEVWDNAAKQRRKEYQLTQDGAIAAACALGGITCGQPVWHVTAETVSCDVPATDHLTGVTVWGTAEAAITLAYTDRQGNHVERTNDNARAIALGKAQRNAIANLIPLEIQHAMFAWYRGETPSNQIAKQEAPRKERQERPKRLRREEHLQLLRTAGDAAVLANMWSDVVRDRHEADAELMEIALKHLKEFVWNAESAGEWNAAVAAVRSIGFASDPELQELIKQKKVALKEAREAGES